MGAISLQTIAKMASQGQLLDEAHERVHWSQEIQHALAMQMNFTAMALLLRSEATVENILRENNRFNNTLARLEKAAAPGQILLGPETARLLSGSYELSGPLALKLDGLSEPVLVAELIGKKRSQP